MKHFIYIAFLVLICSNTLSAQNYYYSLDEETQAPPTPAGITINSVTALIANLKSGANLYLEAGQYTLPSTINLTNISNLTLTGADGAVIEGNLKTLIKFNGTAKTITFDNIKFSSTSTDNSGDYGGGILYFDNASAEDISFKNCFFTSPNAVTNGLKFVSENAARSKNITLYKCKFYDIGRMGFETQNHNNDGVIRISGVSVTECDFQRLGLQSPYGMAISLSGSGKNATLSNNNIVDSKARGIENVGWGDITISNNTFSSPTTAYAPITCQKDINGAQYILNVVIKNNKGTVSGSADHLVEISNCDGAIFSGNNFHTDALHLYSTKNSKFSNNIHYSDGGIGLYVENSSYNDFTNNTFVTTANSSTTIVFYPGSTGNTLSGNTAQNLAGGGVYNDKDGGNDTLDQ